jgi:hypothetical protein
MTADLLAAYDAADDKAAFLARLDAEDAERDRRLRAPGALAAAAGWYASQNIRIFPCEVGGKRPLGALVRNGLKNASADVEQVKAWWTAEPQANIGMPTGHGFDVIDVDGPVGWASLNALEADGALPSICRAFTGGGGLHLFYPSDGGGNGARIAPGIDVRAAGGYVIAPPSRHASGELYRWHPDTPPTLLAAVTG